MTAVVANALVKRYGRVVALDGLDLHIPTGVICGLVGPNGAGKTTAFGTLAGLIAPDSGSVSLFGEGPFQARRHCGRVSLMPQDSAPSPHATLRQSLVYYATLQGLSREEARQQAGHWLGRVRLGDRADDRVGQLSHGMRRRFSLAQALMGTPELILLDEPTAGLDPELVAEVRQLFLERRGSATLIISSHVLRELEELCDHVVFVERGRQVRHGTMASVRQSNTLIKVTLSGEPDLAQLREVIGGAVLEWEAPQLRVTVDGVLPIEQHNARVLRALLDAGLGVLQLEAGESLEESYLARARH